MNAVECFRQVAENNSEKKILYDAGKEYTYGELERQLDQICAHLTKLDNREVLAVSTSKPAELLLYYLAAVERHLYYLPLPPNMTMQEKAENQKLLQMSGSMPFRGCSMVHVDKLKETEEEGEIIFSTGGTSGQKRYVCISHEILYQRCMEAYEYDRNEPDMETLLLTPVWRYLGFKELLRMVLRNQSVTVAPHKDIDAMIKTLQQRRITYVILKSSILSNIIYHESFRTEYFSSVRVLRYCQEPMPMETLIQMQALYPDLQFYSDYGLTETAGTIGVMGPEIHQNAGVCHHIPTTGSFLECVEVALKDENGKEVSGAEVGELYIHVPYQCQNYLGGDRLGYWISTGDMGWFDRDGFFNLSGFRKKIPGQSSGDMYVLPAMARKKYVSIPLRNQLLTQNMAAESMFQNMLALIHASLNVDEIKHFYFEIIPHIVDADAYGFELFPIEIESAGWKNVADQSWYQDAFEDPYQHEVYLVKESRILTVKEMEAMYSSGLDFLYLPLFSRNAQMHGTLIFAKSKEKGKFTSREITLLKQLSHHVNLAVLNARIFQEIQTRQLMLQSTMDFSETGTALSNLNDTIYYMNSALHTMIECEDVNLLQTSSLLDHLKENIYQLKYSGKEEVTTSFACYFKDSQMPLLLQIRSVRLSTENEFVAHFISRQQPEEEINFGDLQQRLSRKEIEVMRYLCKGIMYKDIADAMGISVNTVNFHIKNIYRKMNVNSRNELLNEILYLGSNGLQYKPLDDSVQKQEIISEK